MWLKPAINTSLTVASPNFSWTDTIEVKMFHFEVYCAVLAHLIKWHVVGSKCAMSERAMGHWDYSTATRPKYNNYVALLFIHTDGG